ncbi:hypothetical protein AB4Y64_14500 [Lysobacter sp. TAF61]|uniref:hypothetical protein n=1 Tax=Lysobacter sp. TAF61 TaxID=3233072 RepID=UPI003F9A9AD3
MRYCYFADYEIQLGDHLRVWGQATLVHTVAPGGELDPADVLTAIRRQAAGAHDVKPAQVRVRTVSRLD